MVNLNTEKRSVRGSVATMASHKSEYRYIAESAHARYVYESFEDTVRVARNESIYGKRECKVSRAELREYGSKGNKALGVERLLFFFDKDGVARGWDD